MFRKFAILSATMITCAGIAWAADPSPTEKLMEGINKNHQAIRKATNSAANYKKGAASIPKEVEELVKRAKEAREIKDSSEVAKKPFAEWQKLMDDMIKSAEEVSKVAAKTGSTQVQAKEAYTTYNKTCAACHSVFKKDE